MCVFFQRGILQGENNGKREAPPPAVTLHSDIIIDLNQQFNAVQVYILHQARQMSKGTKAIVGNEMVKIKC